MNIEKNKTYNFKTEFCPALGITKYQIDRRKDDLLIWLSNFYDYIFISGRPERIEIHDIYGEYQPMPRKVAALSQLTQEKKEYYANYVKNHFSLDFAPNSKMRMSRNAINAGGYEKFGHLNPKTVAYTYIKEPFERYGENDNTYIWAFYSTYKPLDQKSSDRWHAILQREHIDEEQAANAFYRSAQGEDVSQEQSYYKKALEAFEEEFNDIPVRVQNWRLKREYVTINTEPKNSKVV